MNENKEISDYLNKKINIKNVACFNKVARLFNLEKTFCSFFESDFNDIVNHKKFLELDVGFLLKLLEKPNFASWFVTRPLSDGRKQIKFTYFETKEKIDTAVNKWVSYNIGERKKYKEVIFATISLFLVKIGEELL